MRLPARFFLVVLSLSIGTLTPIVAPPISVAGSNVSDRCVKMDAGRCHSCPTNMTEATSTFGSSCCVTQSACCALYFTRVTPFCSRMQLIGTVGVNDVRGMTRTQRPPVPPPRGAFS